MTVEQIIGLTVALCVMLFGTAGTLLPAIPGTPIIVAAAIGHRLYFGPQGASTLVLVILFLLALLAMALDYVAGMVGAKRLGATWKGVTGAVVGGIVGLFFSIPGVVLGPFVGATLFELAGGREWRPAARAGLGATLGLVVGAVGKIAVSVTMILLFAINVVIRSA